MKRLGFDLILLGDPTAGKDTQARILMKRYAFKPIESGKYWRVLAKQNTADGKWLRETMSLGHPTPVALMKKFIVKNLQDAPSNKDLIFIGNPRLKPEAQLLVKLLKEKNRDFFVIYLRVPQKEIFKRSKIRLQAGKNKRSDDQESHVRNRLKYYKNQVSKTVAYFKSIKKISFIDSTPPIPMVAAEILKTINDYSRS